MDHMQIDLEIYKECTDPDTGETYDMEDIVSFPAKWDICSRCEGDGHHSNPSIDGNGITESEWSEWHSDEREDYLSGKNDISCRECNGSGKVKVVDTLLLSEEQKKDYEEFCDLAEWKMEIGK